MWNASTGNPSPVIDTMFSETFLHFLIIASLVWTGLGAVVLLVLLIRDAMGKSIW